MSRHTHYNDLRYQTYRSEARRLAHESMASDPDVLGASIDTSQVRFDPIDQRAIDEAHLWGDQATLYPWEDVPGWKRKDRKGFDLALWFDMELCGLCYATPRKSTICIKVILLEGKPDRTHPLKGWVAAFSLAAIDLYARMIGCREIEIEEPEPGAVGLYHALGFDYTADRRLVISVSDD